MRQGSSYASLLAAGLAVLLGYVDVTLRQLSKH